MNQVNSQLELLNAASSFYSMVARLALVEADIPFHNHMLDIHFAKQQLSDGYRELNPQMTVPTLRGENLLLTSSKDILQWAACQAGSSWMDSDISLTFLINELVSSYYLISIEDLTFGKWLSTSKILAFVFPRMLASTVARLENQLNSMDSLSPVDITALKNKAQLNRSRLAYFTEGSQKQKLEDMRLKWSNYLHTIPLIESNQFILGDRFSSIDILLAVLFARLTMINETSLIDRPDLKAWWIKVQLRGSLCVADVWMRMQRRRLLLAAWKARNTVIN
jgi:hypothetical protein